MKYLTFNCDRWGNCNLCPNLNKDEGRSSLYRCKIINPIICKDKCTKCPARFLCFTTKEDYLVVDYEIWYKLRRRWSLFEIDNTVDMDSDGSILTKET